MVVTNRFIESWQEQFHNTHPSNAMWKPEADIGGGSSGGAAGKNMHHRGADAVRTGPSGSEPTEK